MPLRAPFPRGATFIIVGPTHPAYVNVRESNNIEDGTSAARGPFPHKHLRRTRLVSERSTSAARETLWGSRPGCHAAMGPT